MRYKYSSFADLKREKEEGVDYRIRLIDPGSKVVAIAPQGQQTIVDTTSSASVLYNTKCTSTWRIFMSRWLRVIRGMIGTGLTFSAGVGVVASMIAGLVWLLPGGESGIEMIRLVFASSIWAFPIGVAFSGFLAITAHGRSFDKPSLPRFAGLGAGVGLLFFGVLAINAWDAWSVTTAIANATIFILLGGGSATATLMLARRAGPALKSGDESRSLVEVGWREGM